MNKKFIISLAKKAGDYALKHYHSNNRKSYKKNKEIVTVIDKRNEKFLVGEIQKKYPTHNFLGEEYKYKKKKSSYTWVLDPIDGTANFVRQIPLFSVSICLMENDEPILAAIYVPVLKQMFYAKKGYGAYLNNKRIYVSKTKKLDQSIVALSSIARSKKAIEIMKRVLQNGIGFRVLHSTALSLCYIAAGFVDASIKVTVGKYDVAGGVLMVREAKGRAIDFNGEEWKLPSQVIVSNDILEKALLNLVK